MYLQIFFAAAFVAFLYAQYLDATATVRAYKKGGSEGNELVTWFFHCTRPTLFQLQLFNIVEYGVLFLPFYFVNLFTGNPVCGGFAISVAVGMPIGSFLAARQWAKWERS